MKLRTRLIISFIILLLVPLLTYGTIVYDGTHTGNILGLPADAPSYMVRQRVTDVTITILLIVTIVSAMLIIWTNESMMRKIRILVAGVEEIKEGNLDKPMEYEGHDEIAQVAVAIEQMRRRLKEDALERVEAERNQRQLVSNIAHDLKTPLTAIRGYSEGLIDGVAVTPEKQLSYVMTIHNKAEEMNNLLDELTAYSRLDSNRIPYNFQRLDARVFFYDLAEEIALDLANQDIRLVYENLVPEGTRFVGDPVQLTRAVTNCVSNSVKYRKDDEPLVIHFAIRDNDKDIAIEIADNGKGIDPKDISHIFERLYRGDAARSSAGGSGIGLSIVKKIIEDHGGMVAASSRVNAGATIHFLLRKYLPEEDKFEQDIDRRRRRSNRRP